MALLAVSPASAEVRYRGHSEYELPPECRQNMGVVCKVPASIFRRLRQQDKAFMVGYAQDRGIQWRVVKDRDVHMLRPRRP